MKEVRTYNGSGKALGGNARIFLTILKKKSGSGFADCSGLISDYGQPLYDLSVGSKYLEDGVAEGSYSDLSYKSRGSKRMGDGWINMCRPNKRK